MEEASTAMGCVSSGQTPFKGLVQPSLNPRGCGVHFYVDPACWIIPAAAGYGRAGDRRVDPPTDHPHGYRINEMTTDVSRLDGSTLHALKFLYKNNSTLPGNHPGREEGDDDAQTSEAFSSF